MTSRLVEGDAFEYLNIMSVMEDRADFVAIDPPYNVKGSARDMEIIQRPEGGTFSGVTEDWDAESETREDHLKFITKYVRLIKEVTKENATAAIFGSYHNIHDVGHILLNEGGFILNEITWVKANPAPQFRGVRLCNATESILWYRPHGKGKYFFDYHGLKSSNGGKQMRSDWYFPVCAGKERMRIPDPATKSGWRVLHQTQKPLSIMKRLISMACPPGGTVLDFFAGVGTTGLAAAELDREFILVERDQRYVEAIIQDRFRHLSYDYLDWTLNRLRDTPATWEPLPIVDYLSQRDGVDQSAGLNRNGHGFTGVLSDPDASRSGLVYADWDAGL